MAGMNLFQCFFNFADIQCKDSLFISIHEDIQRYDNPKITAPVQILHRLLCVLNHLNSSRIDGIVQILEQLIKCFDDFFQAFRDSFSPFDGTFHGYDGFLRGFVRDGDVGGNSLRF